MMSIMTKKGFTIILVMSLIAVFLFIASAIVAISCDEIIQVRVHNDTSSAYYLAVAGAERMYSYLKNIQGLNQTVTWPLRPSAFNNVTVQMNGSNVGTYTAIAELTGQTNEFAIISSGTVNGRTARVTVKYGYSSTYTNGIPVGSIGAMNFSGNRWWFLTSRVYADGPIESASTISPSASCPNSAPYVQYNGDVVPNMTGLGSPSFWYKYTQSTNSWSQKQIYDVNGDGQFTGDIDGNGYVDASDCGGDAVKLANLHVDDTNNDNKVDNKDAFITYYTVELNTAHNLGINPGGTNYYSGDKTLGPWTIPTGVSMIFVDGDVDIVFNAQKWWPTASDIAVISTQDITVVQPVNGSDDRMTLVAYNNVTTGGINLGELADVDGNMNVYANNNFIAVLGGSTNGSIMAGGATSVTTGLPSFLFNRDLNQGTDSWSDPTRRPIGLPPGYAEISKPFSIKAENLSAVGYKPRWQQR